MNPFRETTLGPLARIRPHLKWVVAGLSALITLGSIWYTNHLVEQIRIRESRQIEIYARSLEFLGQESDNANFILILDEIVKANHTIPVILADANGIPEYHKNVTRADKKEGPAKQAYLLEEVERMKLQHDPISVTLVDGEGKIYGTKLIYYKNSFLLSQLRYYPYVQLSIIALFGMITFLVLNSLRQAEQDRVWVGLAKETAHQLGTPLSSLMAWSEYFKESMPDQKEALLEFDKDIDRLKVITDRFSSIGSEPQLSRLNLTEVIEEVVIYLQKRFSSKIQMEVSSFPNRDIEANLNPSLFAWVIENLCKNAVDSMQGKGAIQIDILKVNEGKVAIDIADTGRGIVKNQLKTVFNPGFTTKKRGWGLGLTLSRRIVEQYHKGKIFIKRSEPNRGTTFRIYVNS